MNRRRLVLAGGAVVWATVKVARHRRPAPRTHSHVRQRRVVRAGLTIYGLTTVGAFGWDGAGFIGSAWGFLTGLAGDIKERVLEAINFAIEKALNAVEIVTDKIQWGLDKFGASISVVADLAHKGLDAVEHVITKTYDMLDEAFANFRQKLFDAFEHFWDFAKDFVRDLMPDSIEGFLGDAWDFLKKLMDIGLDGLQFLFDLIDNPIDFLWGLLGDVVYDAIQAALDGPGELWDAIVKIWDIIVWLGEHADDLTMDVLDAIWDVVKWFVTHIDDFTIDVLESLVSPGGKSLMQRAADETDSEWADATSQVRKLFGLDDNAFSMQ